MPEFTNTCPICQGSVLIQKFQCRQCGTSIEGNFTQATDPFSKLSDEQRHFLLTFVRNEGRLNRMEDILGISYPTLKNRLNDVIVALGYPAETRSGKPGPEEKQAILDDLEAGRIDSKQALRYLHGEESFTIQKDEERE